MAVRQNRLGQADAQTTMDYTHAVTADERRIAGELGKILHVTAGNEPEEGRGCGGLQPSVRTLSFLLFYNLAESHQTQQGGLKVPISQFRHSQR